MCSLLKIVTHKKEFIWLQIYTGIKTKILDNSIKSCKLSFFGGGVGGTYNVIDHSLGCKDLFFYQATFVTLFHSLPNCPSFKSEYLDARESPRVPLTNEVLLAGNNVLDLL